MAQKQDFDTFSIRLPSDFAKQITKRAMLMRRSRNSEIYDLLVLAMESQVKKDLEIMQMIKEKNHPTEGQG